MIFDVQRGLGARREYSRGRAERGRGERGAVLVELAIILPLVILLTFGIIEYSYAFNADSTVSQAARAGGRTASAQPRDPNMEVNAAQAVASALQTLPANQPKFVMIYKANGSGTPPGACGANCVRFDWIPATKSFNATPSAGSSWVVASRNACIPPFDQVGVYVQIDHQFITPALFGSGKLLTDHSVFRLEPASSQQCAS
jgi:hypothetical protein